MQDPNKKNYYRPIEVREPKRFTVPMGFNKAVQERLDGEQSVTSSYISMVKRGIRTNDTVLLAIIHVDHNWKELEYERLKKML